jgi:sporulation protein YlmC with PRC-barrel domain
MISACKLQSRPIRTAKGRQLGQLHDLRCEWRGSRPQVTHLVYGLRGLLERLGFRGERFDTIAWARVIEIRDDAIIVAEKS